MTGPEKPPVEFVVKVASCSAPGAVCPKRIVTVVPAIWAKPVPVRATVLPGWPEVGFTVTVVVAVTLKPVVPVPVVAVKFGSAALTE